MTGWSCLETGLGVGTGKSPGDFGVYSASTLRQLWAPSLRPWCSSRRFHPPGDMWQCSKIFWVVTIEERRLLWASGGGRPGMPLKPLKYTGQAPKQRMVPRKMSALLS